MAPTVADPITIVEQAYDLQGDEREWVDGLLQKVGPSIDRGGGIFALITLLGDAPSRVMGSMRSRGSA